MLRRLSVTGVTLGAVAMSTVLTCQLAQADTASSHGSQHVTTGGTTNTGGTTISDDDLSPEEKAALEAQIAEAREARAAKRALRDEARAKVRAERRAALEAKKTIRPLPVSQLRAPVLPDSAPAGMQAEVDAIIAEANATLAKSRALVAAATAKAAAAAGVARPAH